MQTDNVKAIPIRDYLDKQGIYPAKEYSGYGMYKSPFRDEHTPSLKVDYTRNLWYDFGSGEGGSIIDLVMKMHGCPFIEAVERLNAYSRPNGETYGRTSVGTSLPTDRKNNGSGTFSFHRNSANSEGKENGITLTAIKPIGHPVLLEYLKSRKIGLGIVREHCSEVHYQIGGRDYYAIGFTNDAGGYEIRNPSFKGCIAPKEITHIRQTEKKETCYLFEGFMDYLSFLTIRKNQNPQLPCTDWQDYIVLNSTANFPKALSRLADYGHTYCFLDNDVAGRATYKELEKELGYRIRDASRHYSDHKDLNDFLCAKKDVDGTNLNRRTVTTPQPPMKKNRGLKM